jgi:tetratricopeptide (TPR) repeat protein
MDWSIAVPFLVFFGWMAGVCLHEFGHALVAYLGGDTSVKDKGYLTLNPLRYIDAQNSLLYPALFLMLGGIALPGAAVYIDHSRLKSRAWESAVAAAGPLASLLVAIALAVPFWLLPRINDGNWIVYSALAFLALLKVSSVILNLLPVPSFDGFGIIEPWLPPAVQEQLAPVRRWAVFAVFGALWLWNDANRAFWGLSFELSDRLGIPLALIDRGGAAFDHWSKGMLAAGVVVYIAGRRLAFPHLAALDAGKEQLRQGNYQKALTAFERALKARPDLAEAWEQKASTLNFLGRYAEVEEAAERALALDPALPFTRLIRAEARAQRGQFDGAMADYDALVAEFPDLAVIRYQRGYARLLQGEYGQARPDFEQVLALDPAFAAAHSGRGLARLRQGNPTGALDDVEEALRLDPDDPEAHYNRALVSLALDRQQQAIDDLRCARDLCMRLRPQRAHLEQLRSRIEHTLAQVLGPTG